MNNPELYNNRLKEQRTLEAMRKNLMGTAGKFYAIARIIGNPIIDQSGLYDATMFAGIPQEEPEDEIKEFDDDASMKLGYMFDGLSRGMHLEIVCREDENKILVNFKGYKVYEESNNHLEAYAPFDEWENLVDKLFNLAQNQKKELKPIFQNIRDAQAQKEQKGFLTKLRLRWGI